MTARPILSLRNGSVTYECTALFTRQQGHHALTEIDLTLYEGEAVAIVGRSGSGKSTLARCLAGLQRLSSGELSFSGGRLSPAVQLLFQDSPTALNPRWTVRDLLLEPVRLSRRRMQEADLRVMLTTVGLREDLLGRRSLELSGGQRQRVALARALLVDRLQVLVLDEPFSGLDPDSRNDLIALVMNLRVTRGFATIYISHDLTSVRRIASRVLVLDQGRLVDHVAASDLRGGHPTTRALWNAMLWPES